MNAPRIAILSNAKGFLFSDCLVYESFRSRIWGVLTDGPCGTADIAHSYALPVLSNSDSDNQRFSDWVLSNLQENEIDYLVILFSRLLKGELLDAYQNRIFNFHSSILPSFKGYKPIEDATKTNVRFLGNSVHIVDETVDGGPILMQGVVLRSYESFAIVRHELYQQQCKMFMQVVAWLYQRRVVMNLGQPQVTAAKFSPGLCSPNLDDPDAQAFSKPIPRELSYAISITRNAR